MKQTVKKGKSATSKRSSVGALTPLTKAQKELVAGHIPFAMNMGKKYAGLGRFKGIPVEDLQQEACFGLCIAAQNYNPEKGAAFQTYAHDWCKKFIMMAINNEPLDAFDDPSTGSGQALDVEDIDVIEDDDEQAFAEERVLKVEALLAVLNAQEKKVVCMIYGIGSEVHNFKEVAQKMKLQTARVHQIYEKSLNKMEKEGLYA